MVLVSPDSLRVDRLRPFHPEGVAVPSLEGLAARGVLFENAWATAPWTAPAMVSVFTGLYPPSHGVVHRDDTTPPALPTLPRLLAEEGYRIGNFSFFSRISYFRNLGLGPAAPGLSHGTVADGFRRWLGELPAEEPFFAWLHLLEPHLPYGATGYRATEVRLPGSSGLEIAQLRAEVPVGRVEFAPGDRRRLLDLYDQDVAAMDRTLGAILEALEEAGRLERTVVVFVADHGEELLEHGWVGHASTAIEAKLVPEILRVPLVVAGPGVPAGVTSDALVQPLDLFPTLARLLGVELPEPVDGRVLPEAVAGIGFFESWRLRLGRRDHAFSDSSAAGNLTPAERRGERLQGVTDGRCLASVHTRPGRAAETTFLPAAPEAGDRPCPAGGRAGLLDALGRWGSDQAAGRLRVLTRAAGGRGRPASPELDPDGLAEDVRVEEPRAGEVLRWGETGGQVALAWEGAGPAAWIDYRVGDGALRVEGRFQVEQSRVVFGPFPQGFWNDLAAHSPFRFRVLDPERGVRSPWVEFRVAPVR